MQHRIHVYHTVGTMFHTMLHSWLMGSVSSSHYSPVAGAHGCRLPHAVGGGGRADRSSETCHYKVISSSLVFVII